DLPGFGPEDELPPFPEDELAEAGRRRSRRTMFAVGGLLAVVLAGGGYYLWSSGTLSNAPPPIIAADATPTKVPPAETPATDDSDSQAKLIYDRVDDGNANETLVTPGEDPIADIPAIPEEDAGNPISRVIIPGGPGIDAPPGDPAAKTSDPAVIADAADPTADAAADSAAAPIGPRKVRTVVVKPDGTIVSSEAAPADGIGDGAAPAADQAAPPPDEFPIPPARTDMDSVLEGDSVAVNTDPLGAAAPPAAPGTVPAADAAPLPPSEDFPDPTVAEAPAPAPAPEPPSPAAPPKPAVVATAGDASGPIDLTPSAPSRPAATGGGALVQVSSQRSEDAARSTFRDLQRRYPNILGSYEPDIQRADLGERGVYFRVRVGPFSGTDAQRLCDNLKAAGGDCIIAR
ncbi:MAG TPA: SPOR domain-containing protein, partial [Bauldia sp.]|nr:SPOR domain-containing protein [Bauldia sp.]